MARRKPAPHYLCGHYYAQKAFSGGHITAIEITDIRQIEYSGGAYSTFLYTVKTAGNGVFGDSTRFAYQCELDRLMVGATSTGKAA